MVTKAGDTAPSLNPNRNLTAANPAKFLGAARHMHIPPQIRLDGYNQPGYISMAGENWHT